MKKFPLMTIISLILLSLFMLEGCKDIKEGANDVGENVVIRSQDRANELKLRKDLQTLNRAIEVFYAAHGSYPSSLDELAKLGVIARIPREAFGGEWNYDSVSGKVTSSSHPEYGTSDSWD